MNQLQTAYRCSRACSWFWAAPRAHRAPCLSCCFGSRGPESGGHKMTKAKNAAELPRRVRLTDQVVCSGG